METRTKKKKKARINSNKKTRDQPILALDVIVLILERLSFVDFHSARCVSPGWYDASKLCIGRVTNPTNPWLILFPEEDVTDSDNIGSCMLYDPRDKSSYTVRDFGYDFATSRCLASCGSWFLMLDSRSSFYLLNLFTRERIPLPSIESLDGWKISDSGRFSYEKSRIGKAVLWVDERSRDYFVVWNFDTLFAYHKKGDDNNSWKLLKPLNKGGCLDMVFKEGKLYVLSLTRIVTVFDFSHGDPPMECDSFPPLSFTTNSYNLVVTLSGQVLISSYGVETYSRNSFFNVFEWDSKSSTSKWRRVESLKDEVLLLDQGITVAAKDGDRIYFGNDKLRRYEGTNLPEDNNGICVYNIQTHKSVEGFKYLSASSPVPFKDARWFLPTFGGKWLL